MVNLFFIYHSEINYNNSACVQLLPWLMRRKGWFSWAKHVLTLVWWQTSLVAITPQIVLSQSCKLFSSVADVLLLLAHPLKFKQPAGRVGSQKGAPVVSFAHCSFLTRLLFFLIYPFSLTWSLFKVFHGKVYNSCLARRVLSVVD